MEGAARRPAAEARLARLVRQVVPSPCAGGDPLVGQVAVVTGGGQGIGLEIARVLGQRGAAVCLLDFNAEALAKAVRELQANGTQCKSYTCDVTSEPSVKAAFDALLADHRSIDILVQAAGITGKTNIKTHEVALDNFRQVFAVNVDGLFLCARAAIPSMLAKNYGRIVNIASISGKEGNAGMLAYSSSKAAVIGLTKVMGKEYANTGITVNCLAPAVVQTAMVDAMPPEQVKYMTDKIPMARTGSMSEIANMVAFIASRECSFTTAFCFDATGGRATY